MRNETICGGIRGLLAVLAIVTAVSLGVTAGAWATPFAYVANLSSGTVSAIDTATNGVVATISVERRPSWVAITPDGTRAYVTHDESNVITVIDTNPISLTFNTIVATVASAPPSKGVAITPDGTRAYVSAVFQGSVVVIDTDPHSPTYNTVIGNVGGLGYAPNGVAITPDGTRAYVTHSTYFRIDQVSVIDINPASPTYNTRIAIVGVGGLPFGVAITPDGTRAYVANAWPSGPTSVSVIDANPASPTYNTAIANVPYGVWTSPIGVAITPDGTKAYITLQFGGVSVVDADPASSTYNQVVATVGVGSTPFGVAITPDGKRAYVANSFSNTVSVIDTASNTQIAAVGVGGYPVGIAITPAPRDIVAPTTTANTTPAPNANGWNNTPVTVNVSAADNVGGSGVQSIVYSVSNGSSTFGTTVNAATASFTVFAEGINTVMYHAIDEAGNTEVSKTLVVRIDKTPPTGTLSLSPDMLWPPNHRLVTITPILNASDPGGGPVTVSGPGVTSNEPQNGLGDGDTAPDWVVSGNILQLRAERAAGGSGRAYSVMYTLTDQAGNTAQVDATVTVPHDRGR